jgi:thiamine-phosphate pyrophosphorylase
VTAPVLIAITDEALSDEEMEARTVRLLAAVPAGSTALQLRDRRRSARAFLARAERLRPLCARYGAPFIVNDRLDVARAVDADGAHLGGRSIDVADARRLLGDSVFLSVAAHDLRDVEAAAASGASAALVSPIYSTPGKGPPRGLAFVIDARARAVHMLVYALGGIDAQRAPDCARAGADGVAAIRSVWDGVGGASAACAMVEAMRARPR